MNANDIIEMTFNVTWYCPNNCSYCYRARTSDQKHMLILNVETLKEECKRAKALGIKSYRFSGGEPVCIGDLLFEYADIVFEITNEKPILMTSGYQINENWMNKARNKFSSIAVSVDNPLICSQSKRIIDLITENHSTELPFVYGLTLVDAETISDTCKIFEYMYEKANFRFMPQLDYMCLGNYIPPNNENLECIKNITKYLFSSYGIIPYYFVYLIGSLIWINNSQQRIAINLNPEGNYQIHQHCEERISVEYAWREYLFTQQKNSSICQQCEWIECCRHHPIWDLRYDWCDLRKALFEGIFEGLSI